MTLHETALRLYGGLDGVRDPAGLRSAIHMAQQGFSGQYLHEFPFHMASAYAFHIAESQAFVDGNKRTAFSACVVFLRLNGWSLRADQEDAERQIRAFALKEQSKDGFAAWLQSNSRPTQEISTQ